MRQEQAGETMYGRSGQVHDESIGPRGRLTKGRTWTGVLPGSDLPVPPQISGVHGPGGGLDLHVFSYRVLTLANLLWYR